MTFYFDGTAVYTTTDHTNYNTGMYMIVENSVATNIPSGDTGPWYMYVDYVKAWAQGASTVSASPSSISPGGSTTVSYTGVGTVADWVGVYSDPNAADSSRVDYFYTNSCTKTAGGSVVASGSCNYSIANAGTYQFRLFQNNGWTKLATTNNVTVSSGGGGTYNILGSNEYRWRTI